jgi:hypothetical protein
MVLWMPRMWRKTGKTGACVSVDVSSLNCEAELNGSLQGGEDVCSAVLCTVHEKGTIRCRQLCEEVRDYVKRNMLLELGWFRFEWANKIRNNLAVARRTQIFTWTGWRWHPTLHYSNKEHTEELWKINLCTWVFVPLPANEGAVTRQALSQIGNPSIYELNKFSGEASRKDYCTAQARPLKTMNYYKTSSHSWLTRPCNLQLDISRSVSVSVQTIISLRYHNLSTIIFHE